MTRRIVLVLAMLAALVVLYGCAQASSPPERQEKQGGVEEVAPEEVEAPQEVAENEQAQGATDSKPPGEGRHSQQQWIEKYGPHQGSAAVQGPQGEKYETWVALCRWSVHGTA